MNCKEGDLAYIVGARLAENKDRIVTVVRASTGNGVPPGTVFVEGNHQWIGETTTFCWWVESIGSPLAANVSTLVRGRPVPDSMLRPIRDQQGEDETLEWAPVPGEKVTAGVVEVQAKDCVHGNLPDSQSWIKVPDIVSAQWVVGALA